MIREQASKLISGSLLFVGEIQIHRAFSEKRSRPLYDLAAAKIGDLIVRIPELCEDGIGVLADRRRPRADRGRRGAQLRPRRYEGCGPRQTRIVDLRQVAARANMRILEHLL